MIVILCESHEAAKESYEYWLTTVICQEGADFILEDWPSCLCFETDDNLRYIFMDYRMSEVMPLQGNDFIDEDRFFEGIDDYCGDPFIEADFQELMSKIWMRE